MTDHYTTDLEEMTAKGPPEDASENKASIIAYQGPPITQPASFPSPIFPVATYSPILPTPPTLPILPNLTTLTPQTQDDDSAAALDAALPDLQVHAGTIQFSNVTYTKSPTDPPTLRNLCLRIEAGQSVAIVGLPSSGRTTLLKLLIGLDESYGGRITIDGQEVRSVNKGSLMRQVSVAPQSVVLLEASVHYNVCFGRLASRQRVEDACRIVGLHERVSSLPNGYDEVLGPSTGCSTAEMQKLGLARILVADTKVVLIDEALSELDAKTECRILRYLQQWGAGRTVITVAHRLGTITHSDRIYVLYNGMIVEGGTHRQLMSRPGLYRQLWDQKRTV